MKHRKVHKKDVIEKANKGFDAVANIYSEVLGHLPHEYTSLIKRTFRTKKNGHIIDLGCGTGLLTFELLKLADNVEGLDASIQMINIAKQRDTNNGITWICLPVEYFKFREDFYSLIISYESFHLFSEIPTLIDRAFAALKSDGNICIAWCQLCWEELFRDCIIDSFGAFGIIWDEWGFQSCPRFSEIIRESTLPFSTPQTEEVVVSSIGNVHSIAKYLTCINKALVLTADQRKNLEALLVRKFLERSSSHYVSGLSRYYICHSSKRS